MNEDSWLEAAYEDRNGGDVDTAATVGPWEECSNDWRDSPCGGELVSRVTSGGYPDTICENHLSELQGNLAAIAERYPEIYHYEYCTCYGCSDGSY